MNIVKILKKLDDDLGAYQPPKNNIWTKWIGCETARPPRGLYLYGSVGCGKTFLMDLFYENCSIATKVKQRIHFHRFMLDVHSKIHQIKQKRHHARSSQHALNFNPIPRVAKSIASDSWLLCLDEFQVTDVADAMILKQLFKHLFEEGVILVATSNRAPDDLYKSGLQRSSFLPFIDLLKGQCNVKCLDSNIDYRKSSSSFKGIYFLTTKESHTRDLDYFFNLVSLSEKDVVRPRTITVNNRNVHLKKTCGGIIDCDFSELCEQPLGADDYDCIGKSFHTVIIRNIPKFNSKLKSEAKRFITLIDILYDARTRVVFSADAPLCELFALQSDDFHHIYDDNRTLLDDLDLKGSDTKISLFTGEEEIFALDRTVSRIVEMQTNQYWESARVYG